jgi:hypothetical protein
MSITSKSITRLRWSGITPKVRRELAARGIEHGPVQPADEVTDCEIKLLGEYEGVGIQIGDGYLSVFGTRYEDGDPASWLFCDLEEMDFPTALTKALAYARTGATD